MNFTCNECNDSGSRDKLGTYLDCNACGTATTRRDLNDFVKSLTQRSTYPVHPEDVALAIHQRALAMAPKQEALKPTDISQRLREYAGNSGYSHNDYADTMRAAADEIERYYGGMMNWKKTAEAKDAAPAAANGVMTELPDPLEIDWPELHSSALGCGVEDRGLHDRYECAEYGWQDGVDKAAVCVPDEIYDADQMRAYGQSCHAMGRGAAVREYIENGTFKQPILAAAGPDAAPQGLELAAEQLAEYCENMGYYNSYVDDVRAALSGAKGN